MENVLHCFKRIVRGFAWPGGWEWVPTQKGRADVFKFFLFILQKLIAAHSFFEGPFDIVPVVIKKQFAYEQDTTDEFNTFRQKKKTQ